MAQREHSLDGPVRGSSSVCDFFVALLRARLFSNSILLIQISFAFSSPFALIMYMKSLEARLSASR
jgi:hypothetical protein